jgi:hypothetical protein
MKTLFVLGIAAVVAGCACRPASLTTGSVRDQAPNVPATATRGAGATPIPSSVPNLPDADAPRAFLLQLLDAARRRDFSAWSVLESRHLRARDLQSAAWANLRMEAWANDLGKLEAAIRTGRVFTKPSGDRTAIMVEAPGQRARAVAFVKVEDNRLRLDEN